MIKSSCIAEYGGMHLTEYLSKQFYARSYDFSTTVMERYMVQEMKVGSRAKFE